MELLIILLCIAYVSVQSFVVGFVRRWRERRAHQDMVNDHIARSLNMYKNRHTMRRYSREDRHPR